MTYDKPLPDVTDPATQPFWTGLAERRLMVQQCTSCHTRRYPAAPICPECLAPGADWTEIAPTGTLWSYVVYYRDLAGTFSDLVPYAVGIVEVEDRLHIVAMIDALPEEITIGASVEAQFADVTENVTLLRWALRVGDGVQND